MFISNILFSAFLKIEYRELFRMPRSYVENGKVYVYGNTKQNNSYNNNNINLCVATKHSKFDLDWHLECYAESLGFNGLSNRRQVVDDFITMLHAVVKHLAEVYYFKAPRWAYGHQGLQLPDICSVEFNVPSSRYLSEEGYQTCKEYVDNKLVGYSTLVVTAIAVLVVYHVILSLPKCVAFMFDFVFYRPQRLADAKKQRVACLQEKETQARNAMEREQLIAIKHVFTTVINIVHSTDMCAFKYSKS
jgi:hypothetical protein